MHENTTNNYFKVMYLSIIVIVIIILLDQYFVLQK